MFIALEVIIKDIVFFYCNLNYPKVNTSDVEIIKYCVSSNEVFVIYFSKLSTFPKTTESFEYMVRNSAVVVLFCLSQSPFDP